MNDYVSRRADMATKHLGCRYCNRYRRACGRDHTQATRGDWARAWDGTTPADNDTTTPQLTLAEIRDNAAGGVAPWEEVELHPEDLDLAAQTKRDHDLMLRRERDMIERRVRQSVRAEFFHDDYDAIDDLR